MFELVLGTNNAKKLIELRLLLPEDQVQLTLAEIPESIEVKPELLSGQRGLEGYEQAKHLNQWVS